MTSYDMDFSLQLNVRSLSSTHRSSPSGFLNMLLQYLTQPFTLGWPCTSLLSAIRAHFWMPQKSCTNSHTRLMSMPILALSPPFHLQD
ncbi:hypothetical protein GOP47_0024411 [Adiantum capillus-veneris]|uniref:Uncharacterized protein n=1 Tax=Adiantum capillus-veneris TaxID=13818 RepID=A0A9D4U1P7_ADICA|nr:hypothetical protein GOP47_0024411 [Adiantum capillus-veneris]